MACQGGAAAVQLTAVGRSVWRTAIPLGARLPAPTEASSQPTTAQHGSQTGPPDTARRAAPILSDGVGVIICRARTADCVLRRRTVTKLRSCRLRTRCREVLSPLVCEIYRHLQATASGTTSSELNGIQSKWKQSRDGWRGHDRLRSACLHLGAAGSDHVTYKYAVCKVRRGSATRVTWCDVYRPLTTQLSQPARALKSTCKQPVVKFHAAALPLC